MDNTAASSVGEKIGDSFEDTVNAVVSPKTPYQKFLVCCIVFIVSYVLEKFFARGCFDKYGDLSFPTALFYGASVIAELISGVLALLLLVKRFFSISERLDEINKTANEAKELINIQNAILAEQRDLFKRLTVKKSSSDQILDARTDFPTD